MIKIPLFELFRVKPSLLISLLRKDLQKLFRVFYNHHPLFYLVFILTTEKYG